MKLSTRISAIGFAATVATTLVVVGVVLVQKNILGREIGTVIAKSGPDEAAKITETIYQYLAGMEKEAQRRVTNGLGAAREVLSRCGQPALATNSVPWHAVDQMTKEARDITLPKMMFGTNWLGQVSSATEPALVVDEVKKYTQHACTVFQRMNEEGDMLRVCTSILTTNGTRAVGTYIARRNGDGSENPVIAAVLRGETYHGRAVVVGEQHAVAYEPIWDAGKKQVLGMLFAGLGMADVTKEVRQSAMKARVGKTGYVYVLGGKGDQRGRYIVSKDGLRDGENIWEAKDPQGGLFIQSIIKKGLETKNGSIAHANYPWRNQGETQDRMKFAAIAYFEPWDWVIAASAYEDDFEDAKRVALTALTHTVGWILLATACVMVLAIGGSYWFAHRVSQALRKLVHHLTEASDQVREASTHVSAASQSLAEGASEQAASLEETSASLEEIASMTKRNTENADKTNDLARHARQAADVGATDMQSMSTAMDDIKGSSDEISKIIKTIDEIAFQTNILALNAAVEAARAGEAGMGFAVVADEVRNLAQRSAQAAKETSAKIEGAIRKTAQGVQISSKVGEQLQQIVGKIREVDSLAAAVATASREQTQGIDQVNTAVSQMDRVTQSNAASAEESASAAEELNAQAEAMRQSVGSLEELIEGRVTRSAGPRAEPGDKPNRPMRKKLRQPMTPRSSAPVRGTPTTVRPAESPVHTPSDSQLMSVQ